MGSHLEPLLANAFLAYHEQNYPLKYTPLHYRQYFDVMFVLFKSSDHLTLSRQRSISYRNQSIDLQNKSMDWFLYDIGLRRERVKTISKLFKFLSC